MRPIARALTGTQAGSERRPHLVKTAAASNVFGRRNVLRFIGIFIATAAAVLAGCMSRLPARIFMIGDSTMAEKPLDLPERGWGMALREFFIDPTMVHNHAENGRSTKSFMAEGRWDAVMTALRSGDFVIIQFGHNDEKVHDPKLGTDPATTFRDNLRRFVRDARAKEATPVLATPVCRRKFDASGKLLDTHGAYPDAIRAVAAEENVPLLELEQATARWLRSVGDEPSKRFFMWFKPGEHPKLPNGLQDDTHFVDAGARHVAQLAVDEIRRLKLPLTRRLK